MIFTFETTIKVKVGGKHIGDIRSVFGGYQFFPKGSKSGGHVYATIQACKDSLQ